MIRKNFFRNIFVFLLPFSFVSCSSTHDLKNEGINPFGGGYIDDLLGDGLYLIKAFANLSIKAHESAGETFQRGAKTLCKNGYQEINLVADSHAAQKSALVWLPQGKSVIPILTKGMRFDSKIAYVQCLDSKLNHEEVEKIIIPEKFI